MTQKRQGHHGCQQPTEQGRNVPQTGLVARLGHGGISSTKPLSTGLAFAGDPTVEWRTVESEHFVIAYYEPNGDIARRAAVVAERAHRVLAPALRHEPDEKTLITITDDTDGSNGFASVLPRNQIGL